MKTITDFSVVSCQKLNDRIVLIKLTPADGKPMQAMRPGQFVEVRVEDVPSVFLRRPISIHFVDVERNELWLLVQTVGDATQRMAQLQAGDRLNLVYPLGNGFTLPAAVDASKEEQAKPKRCLLVGGGVGIAPLLQLGAELRQLGHEVIFLLGGRKSSDLTQLEEFGRYGQVLITTEDGSVIPGLDCQRGFVTNHSVWQQGQFDCIRVCGPKPMMKAVARMALSTGVDTPHYCEVSLENKMACGLGVCLCCVEDTKEGHKCVCSDGPVFDVKDLKWE
jgi:dihydroorotate dehydrogenase electron transfer subunit